MAEEQHADGFHVAGNVAVEGREQFKHKEEHVHTHGVDDDGGQGLHGFLAHIQTAETAHKQHQQQKDGRPRTEGRSKEAASHDGGKPVVTPRHASVQEGGNRVDGESPQNRKIDKGLDPFGRINFVAFGFKGNPADDDVQTQVANEHQHVVKHDGIGRGVQHDVEHALGLTKVNHDEQSAHDHGRNGHEFAKNDHALEFFIVVEVRGQHQHNGRGGNTDEVGELRNIQPP